MGTIISQNLGIGAKSLFRTARRCKTDAGRVQRLSVSVKFEVQGASHHSGNMLGAGNHYLVDQM